MSQSSPQYPQSSPYPQAPVPPGHGAPVAARNGLGIASLVLGIVGAVSGLIPFLFWLAAVLGLTGLILGLAGRGRAKRGEATNKGVATSGVVLGLLALVLAAIGAFLTFKLVGDAVKELDKATSSVGSTPGAAGGTDGKAGGGAGEAKGEGTGETLGAGDSAVYDDDLTVTVSKPTPYTPGAYAVGHTKGNKAYKVTVVIENAGKEKFDATLTTVTARAGEDGVEAESVYDDTVGLGFSGTVMPGKKATVQFAFDAPPTAEALTVEVGPGILHDSSQWDLKL
ncbi:DUF4190 domain-containing protein [Streptomyces lushanensis]|uniref:DUF4190 domain-containing protein n=1 Tax=Streptomyces lushanensis TaxID=1434255 RepID=UPI000837A5AE|nr:DUF4190 domain-containing protein [Streptomyces lushanensis]